MSILIMKPDHLGDVLMLTAVLPLLAKRFPGAAIDILCGPQGVAVVDNNPYLRRTIPFLHMAYDRRPVSGCRKLLDFLTGLGHIFPVLRSGRYDLCLNLRDAGGDLVLLARLAGCRHIVGHATGGFGALLDTVTPWVEGCHEVEHFLEVLKPLGIEANLAGLRYGLYPDESDVAAVKTILANRSLERFVVIHPGSGDSRKLRSPSFWGQVIDGLGPDCRVVVTGTEDERLLCDAIAACAGRHLVCLTGELTVLQLFLLLRQATALYALDSLAAHLGGAAGIPVTVFWSETNDPDQWRPLGDLVTVCCDL